MRRSSCAALLLALTATPACRHADPLPVSSITLAPRSACPGVDATRVLPVDTEVTITLGPLERGAQVSDRMVRDIEVWWRRESADEIGRGSERYGSRLVVKSWAIEQDKTGQRRLKLVADVPPTHRGVSCVWIPGATLPIQGMTDGQTSVGRCGLRAGPPATGAERPCVLRHELGTLMAAGRFEQSLPVVEELIEELDADGLVWSEESERAHRQRAEVLTRLGRSAEALDGLEIASRISAHRAGKR